MRALGAWMESVGAELPVQGDGQVGGVTRSGLERFLQGALRQAPRAEPAFTATELPR